MDDNLTIEQLNAAVAKLYIQNQKLAEDTTIWMNSSMRKGKEIEALQAEKMEIEGDYLNLREAYDTKCKKLDDFIARLKVESGVIERE